MLATGEARYYHTDQVDSVKAVTDDAGQVQSRMEYLPFGESWFQEDAASFAGFNLPKYNSQELDKETGYYFYNARHYDPEIGRFVTPDTVVDGAYSSQGWNRFAYVHNNPIRYTDPTGHYLLNKDGSVTFNKKSDTLMGAAKLAGYGDKWKNAANVMNVENRFNDNGRWKVGSKSLVGMKLPQAYFENWTAQGEELYLTRESIHFPSGEGLMPKSKGVSVMSFSNKRGDRITKYYSIDVKRQMWLSLNSVGISANETIAKKEFLAGTSAEEVADSWEGKFYSDDTEALYLKRSSYEGDKDDYGNKWEGHSWGPSLSLGVPYSKTMTKSYYRKIDNIKEIKNLGDVSDFINNTFNNFNYGPPEYYSPAYY